MQGPTIGVLAPFFAGSYYGPVVGAIAQEAWRRGGRVVAVQTASYEAQAEKEGLPTEPLRVACERVDGVVTIGATAAAEPYEDLCRAGKPIVAISSWGTGKSFPMVAPDNSVRTPVEHLLSHGHTRIAFAGCLDHFDVNERYHSFCETLQANGVEPRPDLLYRLDCNTEPGGRRAAELMIAAGMPSTAVVVGTDLNAVGLMTVLKAAGYRLPEDQAIVGFDNNAASAIISPGLSTVSQDFASVGTLAASLLMRSLAGEQVGPGRYAASTSFVVRESCGCALSTAVPPLYERDDARPARRFATSLGLALSPPNATPPAQILELGEAIGATFERAAHEALTSAELNALSGATKDLCQLARSPHTFSVVLGLAHRLSAEIAHGQAGPLTATQLEQCIVQVGHGLSHAAVSKYEDAYLGLRKAVQDEYIMGLNLLGSHTSDPRSLGWMTGTPARAAVLGLWAEVSDLSSAAADAPEPSGAGPAKSVLKAVGTFDATGGPVGPAGGSYPVGSFPPEELIASAVPGELAFVFPVRSGDNDWGFLAAISPYDSAFIGQDTYFEWSAMLSRALERQATLNQSRELELRLRRQALYDNLTGLPNRALFLDRLSQAIARDNRQGNYGYAVLWLDLDGFKVLNDSLGHLAGDQLLAQVADRIRAHLRETDTAARFGGDEFAILLEALDQPSVEYISARLLSALAEPYAIEGSDVVVTASIGIATSATRYERPDEILRDADTAMYRAKAAGRGTFATFDSSMHLKALDRLKTETELRHAIAQGQHELHFQPIVQMQTGAAVAFEALVRWRHPRRGLLVPAQFLDVAEDSGLIVPLGRLVMSEACRQVVTWGENQTLTMGLSVSINLSNREFWDPRLCGQLDELIATSGICPDRLVFEITEGVIMNDPERALRVINALHRRRAKVYIDDFGTGRTSLEALHWLPVDALKVDKGFVSRLTEDRSGRAAELITTIVSLAKSLGFDVICEGVETSAQAQFLVELGCPFGQGYFFSRPMPTDKLEGLLRRGCTTYPVTMPEQAARAARNGALSAPSRR